MTAILHDPQNVLHALAGHPEKMERYTAAMEALGKTGLLGKMTSWPPRLATAEEIGRAHLPDMIARIEQVTAVGGGMLDPDTYCTSDSWNIARMASGGLIDLCLAIAGGKENNGLALLRPPGHHATSKNSMGFCLINHAAIAARGLQTAGLAGKIAIVDFDVHHGNGTEDIFYADSSVFYASTHQYPHYPGTGRAADRGSGPGLGATLNLPLDQGAGDQEFLAAYEQEIIPALENFKPDFMVVSAGYDAHQDDPLAGLNVTDEGYRQVSQWLLEAAEKSCDGKIVFLLEGGYNLKVLSRCLGTTAEILLSAHQEPQA